MISYITIVKSILGRFWLQFWKDGWLIQGLLAIYSKFVYPIFNTLIDNLYIQTSVFYPKVQNVIIPSRVLLVKQGPATKSVESFTFSDRTFAEAVQTTGFQYRIVSLCGQPSILYDNVFMTGRSYTDFSIHGDSLYTTTDFATQPNVSSRIQSVDGQIVACYQLWGVVQHFSPILDNFTAVAKIPAYWSILYPGAAQDAWAIRQLGATKYRVISLLKKICGSNNVYIYQGQTPASTAVARIPVLTSAGVLYAQNSIKNIPANGLPLTGNLQTSLSYQSICKQLSDSGLAPTATIPNRVNPMKFLIQQVWGSSCVIMIVPVVQNQKDMQIALHCILQNMPVGSIVILYQNQIIQQPIQLNLTAQNQMLVYYTKEQRDGLVKEINQWV